MNNRSSWHRTSAAGQNTAVFLLGAVLYSAIEVFMRGYTHWTMTLTGGVCLLIMYLRYTRYPGESILFKCFFGMCTITFFEFTVGCIVNLLLGWNVWDYSDMYMNVLGQICPAFSAAWFLLSLPVVLVCKRLYPGDERGQTFVRTAEQ